MDVRVGPQRRLGAKEFLNCGIRDYKEIKPVNPKGFSPKYSLEGLMLKLQYFGHLT